MPRIGAGCAGAGLLLVVIGTFLDWSRSGMVLRDSYRSVGILRQLTLVDSGPLRWVVDGWFAVVPIAALCVAGYALRARRSAAAVSGMLAIMTGTIGGVATIQGSGRDTLVGLASTGPIVTLIGSLLALGGAVAVVTTERASTTGTRGGAS